MKKVFASSPLLILSLGLLLTACSKGGDDPPGKTRTELITTGTWKFSTVTYGGTDYTALIPTCNKDNTMVFVSATSGSGTGTVDEGPTKCSGGDPQTIPFTWTFIDSETKVNVSGVALLPGSSNEFTIVALNQSQLILSQMWAPPGGGAPQLTVVTFLH